MIKPTSMLLSTIAILASIIPAAVSAEILRLEVQGITSPLGNYRPANKLYSLYVTFDTNAEAAIANGIFTYSNAVKSVSAIVGNQIVDISSALSSNYVQLNTRTGRIEFSGGYVNDSGIGFGGAGTAPLTTFNSMNPLKASLLALNSPNAGTTGQFYNRDQTFAPVNGPIKSYNIIELASPINAFQSTWESPGGFLYQHDASDVRTSFNGNSFTFSLNIGYQTTGNLNPSLLSSYKSGIERAWNNKRFVIADGARYPILFDANFTTDQKSANAFVNIIDGRCHSNVVNWCTSSDDGVLYNPETVAAHEFGHLIGLRDEYWYTDKSPNLPPTGNNLSFLDLFNGNICKGVSTDMSNLEGSYCGSIMATYGGSAFAERLYTGIENYLRGKIGRPDATFGWAPAVDDPYSPPISAIPFELHLPQVPEPRTSILLFAGLLFAIATSLVRSPQQNS